MRRAYNELKSIVVTPVAPMHPYTCVPLHVYTCVGGTHDTIWAYDDREIGRSMITDGGERRTEVTRGGGEGGRLLRKSRGATGGWRDGGGWCRKSEGNVSSLASPLFLSLSLSLSASPRFDEEEGQRRKLMGGETTPGWPWLNHDRSRAALVWSLCICGLVSNRHVSVADQKGLDKGEEIRGFVKWHVARWQRFNRRSRATSFAARLNGGARDLAPRDVSKCL